MLLSAPILHVTIPLLNRMSTMEPYYTQALTKQN